MGTPLYMSPEQVRSLKSVDLRSDIWSLGAILFELLTQAPIYDAASPSALCAMIAMDPPTLLRARRPNAPPELEALVSRCLHKDPAGRFQDVAAFADALAVFSTDRGRLSASRIARVVRGGVPPARGSSPHMGAPTFGTGGFTGGATSTGGNTFGFTGPAPHAASVIETSNPSSNPMMGMTGAPISGATGSGPYPSFGPPRPSQAPPFGPPGVSYPPGAMPAMYSASNFAPAPQGTTQDAWQRQTGPKGAGNAEQRRAGGMLFAIFGIVAALFLLATIAGAGVYIVSQRGGESAKNPGDTNAPTAATAPIATAQAAPAATTAAGPVAATTVKRADPKAGAAGQKDAGGAVAPLAPAAPGAAPTATADDDAARIARLKQIAQGRCSLQQSELSRNDASNSGARNVKLQACTQASSLSPNSGSSSCERANCRTACTILKDQICLLQLDQAERSNPLKF
jgi:serine/threonine-protein kinase